MVAGQEVPIGPDDTLEDLRARLVEVGTGLLVDHLSVGLPAPTPQEGEPTYAAKIEPSELEIDWTRPAVEVHRLVRLGGAWTTVGGRRLKVWRTHVPPRGEGPVVPAADGPVELVEVQPEGKPKMAATAWVNGAAWSSGDPLGT